MATSASGDSAVAVIGQTPRSRTEAERLFRSVLGFEDGDLEWIRSFGHWEGTRIVCSNELHSYVDEKGRIPQYMREKWMIEATDGGPVKFFSLAGSPPLLKAQAPLPKKTSFMVEMFLGPKIGDGPASQFSKAWYASGFETPYLDRRGRPFFQSKESDEIIDPLI